MSHFTRSIATSVWVALVALLTVLMLAGPASADKDDDDGKDGKGGREATATVSTISDERIQESSGMALSANHDDLVYTMNDEGGSGANVYAVRVSTGAVVGASDISALPIEDPESIAVDADGTLWLGDLGDNEHQRNDIAIYAFPEPGPGQHKVSGVDRYQVTLPDGPQDVEGLMVHPGNDRVYIVSKNEDGTGRIFELPGLTAGGTVQAREVGEAPEGVTDATFTHSGQRAVLRTEKDLWLYNPTNWEAVARVETPKLEQGESVTVERGDQTVLLGSEGKDSPIVRVTIPSETAGSGPIDLGASGSDAGGQREVPVAELGIAVVLVALVGIVGVMTRRRSKSLV